MKALGDWGEDEAVRYLERQGLRLVEKQFHTRYGEIDSIFKDGDTYVFVEVKTRRQSSEAFPAIQAVTNAKQRRLTNAAYSFIKMRRLEGHSFRFDLVILEAKSLEWIQNAFDVSPRFTL